MPRQTTPSPSQPNTQPFPYADYVEARKVLKADLNGPCFYALLTGASGMGKTELLRDITDSLDRHRYNVIYIASANISLVSIVRFLAGKLARWRAALLPRNRRCRRRNHPCPERSHGHLARRGRPTPTRHPPRAPHPRRAQALYPTAFDRRLLRTSSDRHDARGTRSVSAQATSRPPVLSCRPPARRTRPLPRPPLRLTGGSTYSTQRP